MSTVVPVSSHKTGSIGIRPGSLLEYLYTYLTLDQLHDLLDSQPDLETLQRWNVQLDEFTSQVRTAIEYVTHD